MTRFSEDGKRVLTRKESEELDKKNQVQEKKAKKKK